VCTVAGIGASPTSGGGRPSSSAIAFLSSLQFRRTGPILKPLNEVVNGAGRRPPVGRGRRAGARESILDAIQLRPQAHAGPALDRRLRLGV
jgi:hypothetical protein